MILWEGKSELTGDPIVVIATVRSRNPKTGDMVQIWILHRDLAPHVAVWKGADQAVCGDCPLRHSLGGACYVQPFQAPNSVWKKYQAGGYESPTWIRRVSRELKTKPVRLGAYGDPAAVPFHVWENLIAEGCKSWSGYTHQWRTCDPRMRGLVMASCDSGQDALEAQARGWRYFLITKDQVEHSGISGAVECLATSRGLTCEECAICDGTRADSRIGGASVVIQVHGQRAGRFLPVLQG